MKKRKPRTIAGIAITAMLIYGTVSMASEAIQLNRVEMDNTKLKSEISSVEKENRKLKKLISESESDEAKENLAEERLRLVKPG